jgi:hypothetical protein
MFLLSSSASFYVSTLCGLSSGLQSVSLARCKVLMAVTMKITGLYDVAPCIVVEECLCLEEPAASIVWVHE